MLSRRGLFRSLLAAGAGALVGAEAASAQQWVPPNARSQAPTRIPPPPPPRNTRVPPPRRGYTWVPGYWAWSSRRRAYVWHEGYWTRSRPGYRYVGPQWVFRGGQWVFIPGRWVR